jgi:hypothetical protein
MMMMMFCKVRLDEKNIPRKFSSEKKNITERLIIFGFFLVESEACQSLISFDSAKWPLFVVFILQNLIKSCSP